MRVALIGDVGGHARELEWALGYLGAEPGLGRLPDDLIVVQVGDLVDRGPDSAGVLRVVRHYLETQPRQWVQLAGNHEAQYLPEGTLFWPDRLSDEDAALLDTWWLREKMQVAAAVRTSSGTEYLVTHAGLTLPCWRDLGEPMTATTAAMLLNLRPKEILWRGLGDFWDDGPFWAAAGQELCDPWMEHARRAGTVPFGQIHGHSAIVRYDDGSWRASERVRDRAVADFEARRYTARIGGHEFIGIDPKHGRDGAPRWQPLVFDDATVVQ